MEVLGELGINGKPMIVVLNKTDLVDDPIRLHELEIHFEDAVFISVKTGAGFVELTHRLNSMIVDRVVRLHLRVPQARTDLESLVHREGKTLATEYEGNDILLDCVVPKRLEAKFEGFVENETQAPSP